MDWPTIAKSMGNGSEIFPPLGGGAVPERWEFPEGEWAVEKREKVVGQDKSSGVTMRPCRRDFYDLANDFFTVRTASHGTGCRPRLGLGRERSASQ